MATLMSNDERLTAYFCSLNISKTAAKQMSESILHWIAHKGIEYAVSRLKDLKTQRVHFENGSALTLVRSRRNYHPVGSFSVLWDTKLSFQVALQALNVYTSVISKVITRKQAEKFVDSVNFVGPLMDTYSFVKLDERVILRSFNSIQRKHPLGWIRGIGKRAPVVRNGVLKTTPENSLHLRDYINDAIVDESTRMLLLRHRDLISRSLGAVGDELYDHIRNRKGAPWPSGSELYSNLKSPPVIGRIGLIQERGMKLRAVANPFRLWQHVLTPLGDFLLGILGQLDWDCTFDQERGISYASDRLALGCEMFAFDLSNATDRFPLGLQLDALESIMQSMEKVRHKAKPNYRNATDKSVNLDDLKLAIPLLRELARGRWAAEKLAPYNGGSNYLQWKTGQPLGLYPSFALFALTHGLLLKTIESELGIENSFRVLGDDVVISHPEVARVYKERILAFGCLISESKSLVSKDMTEFAGKLITSKGIVPVMKWSEFSPQNPYGPLRVLGTKGLAFIPPRWRKKVRKLASLPMPYGLELNPDGIPLQDRVDACEDKLYPVKEKEITDYTLTYADLHDQLSLWWQESLSNGRHYSERERNSYFLPRIDDLPIHSDRIRIEHYNAHVRSLKGWDHTQPALERPDVTLRLPDRSVSSKFDNKDQSPLFKLLKTFRGFINKMQS